MRRLEITGDYWGLLGITRNYKGLLLEITKVFYRLLKQITRITTKL